VSHPAYYAATSYPQRNRESSQGFYCVCNQPPSLRSPGHVCVRNTSPFSRRKRYVPRKRTIPQITGTTTIVLDTNILLQYIILPIKSKKIRIYYFSSKAINKRFLASKESIVVTERGDSGHKSILSPSFLLLLLSLLFRPIFPKKNESISSPSLLLSSEPIYT
jgi:hypothetical protein